MGRLSRYKKTKAFDPFYNGNKPHIDAASKKSKNIQKRKVPLQGIDEQKMPRSMKMLIERAKKMKTRKKLKRLDNKERPSKIISFERRKDENQKEYFQRIDREASTAVMESMKKQNKMSDRRKNHLKKRKEKLKTQKNPERIFKAAVEFTDLKDDVRFGEVAEQPPVLTAKPRNAAQTQDKKSLLLNSKLSANQKTSKMTESTPKKTKAVLAKTKKRKHMSESEKAIMYKERQRVIEMYRNAKKKTISNSNK